MLTSCTGLFAVPDNFLFSKSLEKCGKLTVIILRHRGLLEFLANVLFSVAKSIFNSICCNSKAGTYISSLSFYQSTLSGLRNDQDLLFTNDKKSRRKNYNRHRGLSPESVFVRIDHSRERLRRINFFTVTYCETRISTKCF